MPEVLTFFLADDVRREADGKVSAIGMYFNVHLTNIETSGSSTKTFFVTVTEVPEGTHSLVFRAIHSRYKMAMDTESASFESRNEKDILTLLIKLDEFQFPASGTYRLELLIDGQQCAQQVVQIRYDDEPEHGFTADEEATSLENGGSSAD